jgi:hypothetical protein
MREPGTIQLWRIESDISFVSAWKASQVKSLSRFAEDWVHRWALHALRVPNQPPDLLPSVAHWTSELATMHWGIRPARFDDWRIDR